MVSNCKLAVIIPCYNYELFVGRAIDSVKNQCESECDLVVVDDSSTDNSWDIIKAHAPGKLLQVPNGGAAKACIAAATLTNATHILVLDADDELAPGSIRTLLSVIEPSISKIQFSLDVIDAEGRITSEPSPRLSDFKGSGPIVREIAKTGSYTNPPTSGNVLRRDVFDLIADVDYESFVDGVTLFAAPFMGDVISMSDALGRYRIHGKNASGLGSATDPKKLRRDIERFGLRLGHVRRALLAKGIPFDIPCPKTTFFYRERELYLDIAENRRPSVTQIVGLQFALLRQPMSIKRKIALSLFTMASVLFSNSKMKAMLLYRMNIGHRSVAGLLKQLF